MQRKSIILVFVAFVLSVLLGYISQNSIKIRANQEVYEALDKARSLFPQDVLTVSNQAVEVTKLYHNDNLIGVIHDENRLLSMFNKVYEEEYEAEFPDSKLGFVDDIMQVKELSYNVYEDRDDDIFNYIYEEDLFAIEVYKIVFSNGYVLHVKDLGDFNSAKEKFIKNFISNEAYESIKQNEALPELVEYGSREIDLEVLVSGQNEKESIQISRGLASKDQIKMDENEILTFLSYGPEPTIETYKVQEFDTIGGIAMNHGMNPAQIASINRDQIKDENQVLEEGMELKVSKFNSPFTVRVVRERKTSEVIYPESTIYQSDPNLKEGLQEVEVKEKNGSRDVIYQDVYENGETKSSKEVSSKVVVEPVRGVIRYGTKVEPKVGSGMFRWPLNNAYVLCGWQCYPNHRGVDFAVHGSGYGPIYAADRGVVVANSYNAGGWGYYIKIDHGNGYQTLYAHMRSPGFYPVGSTVAKGDNIGYVGMTGRTTYPHVHLEVWRGGTRINPCSVMAC